MKALDARQIDALTELINISFGLTAAKLSEISRSRVLLEPPIIGIHPLEELAKELGLLEPGDVSVVHQAFTGPISGDALLFLDSEGAVKISNLFVDESLRSGYLDPSTGEVLAEIGNMLLGSCLGVFGNLLEVRISFSVPVLHMESLEPLLASLSVGEDELRHAVVIATSFRIREYEVAGQIAIVLGASSLDRLVNGVEVWERSQCSV